MQQRADRCPGVLRLIEAVDGLLARVRLPGGLVTGAQLLALAEAATELGDGRLELTSRGNVQLRGLAGAGALVERLVPAGLLPSPTHERVRNIVASPLAGLDSPVDLVPLVRALDRALCADPRMAELSGRFHFALDDGRGDVLDGADARAVVGVGAAWVEGSEVAVADVPAALLRFAHAFLDEREPGAWHVPRIGETFPPLRRESLPDRRPIGRVGPALVVGVPLGRLTLDQARWLAGRSAELRVTPWRRIVLPAAPVADPSAVGLVTDPDDPWLTVSACAGRPRCAQALADVQTDAAAALGRFGARRVHWSGCGRRCGRPSDTEVDVVATDEGYAISD